MVCAWEWFPEKKSLITGLCLSAFGFGTMTFSTISTAIVNPDNEQITNTGFFPKEVADRVPQMFMTLATIWAMLAVIGITVTSRKEKNNEKIERSESDFIPTLISRKFLHLFSLYLLGVFYSIHIASYFKTFAQQSLDDHTLTIAGSVGSLCMAGSKLMWSLLYDHFGFKRIYACIMLTQIVVAASITMTTGSPMLYTIFTGLSFAFAGAHCSLFATFCAEIFGI